MRRILYLFALMPMLGSVLCGDWKIVTRTGPRTVTEFFKGALVRTDSIPAYTAVLDFDHRKQVNWRSDLRQYVVVEWPSEQHDDASSGPVIVIERNTTDTGERKQFFGRTARQMVTRTTRSDGPESVIDGWYIEAPGLPKWKLSASNSVAILTISVAGQKPAAPRIQVKQTGPSPEGLAVWQRTTSFVALPGASPHNFDTVSEVIDLVEGILPDELFHQPAGYRRVASFPNTALKRDLAAPGSLAEVLRAHWQMIEDWISSLFAAKATL